MTLADDDPDIDDAWRHTANLLQARQQITSNAIMKRKEQLTRWLSSEMNSMSTGRRDTKVQFQDADIFLSACMSGDEDEVEDLLEKGADINTATIDGLTALHQSVIDSKPEMVRFLCEKGADIDAQDNEGWTPLHAAACCGNIAILRYLCQNGGDLTIINTDKELAVDLAEEEVCREYLENQYRLMGIDLEKCRNRELSNMMEDAQKWLISGVYGDVPHPRTGATALHVAAAKGYTQLMEILIKAGADINAEDHEGWTPLHAAAHWGEREASKILIEHGASITHFGSQNISVLSVADKELLKFLEELEKSCSHKKRTASNPPPSVLAEKNPRVDSPENALTISSLQARTQHQHQHFMSSEQKHALAIKDEREEAETLQIEAKQPHQVENSASPDRRSTEEKKAELTPSISAPKPPEPAIEKLIVSDSERMSVDRSSSSSTSASATTAVAIVKPEERTSSVEMSPEVVNRPSAFKPIASSASERSLMSNERSSHNSGSTTTSGSTTALSSVAATSDKSKSSEAAPSVSASATVPLRPMQQSNSWINRNVPLAASRATSSSSPDSCESWSKSSSSAAVTTSASSVAKRSTTFSEEEETETEEELTSQSESLYSQDTATTSKSSASTTRASSIASAEVSSEATTATTSSSLSSAYDEPTVHVTVRQPFRLNPTTTTTPAPLTTNSGPVARSASTPSASLPWLRSNSTSSASSSAVSAPAATTVPVAPSASTTAFASFLAQDRVSAFKQLPKKTIPQSSSSIGSVSSDANRAAPTPASAAPTATSGVSYSAPSVYSQPSPPSRPSFKPQPLQAPMLRPWQATAPTVTNESEAERRKEARMHRHFRRSTQGVTKEQLEEASRVAAEEQAKKRVSSRNTGGVRLASEERDTSEEPPLSDQRMATSPASPSTSATLTLASASINTPSAANIRNKKPFSTTTTQPSTTTSTSLGGGLHTASRAARRGTGPVLPDDVHAAVSLRCVAPTTSPAQRAAYAPGSGATFASGAPSGFPVVRSTTTTTEKSNSVPPAALSSSSQLCLPSSHSPPTYERGAPFLSWYGRDASGSVRFVPRSPSTSQLHVRLERASAQPGAHASRSVLPTTTFDVATTQRPRSASATPITMARTRLRLMSSYGKTAVRQAAGVGALSRGGPTSTRSAGAASTTPSTNEQRLNGQGTPNYKAMYEALLADHDKLKMQFEEQKKTQMNGVGTRRTPGNSTTSSVSGVRSSSSVARSCSGVSLDDVDRRALEKRIADLEFEVKSLSMLRAENQRLKEENGALVRVISKMTT